MLKKGILIAFVGIDGAGKTTHSKLLFKYLKNYTTHVELVKAYNTSDAAVLGRYKNHWDDVSLTLFFQMLHRFQSEKTRKILDGSGIAIADKWNEAYFAYHNHFGFLANDSSLRKALDIITFSDQKPDICFYMRVPAELVRRRLTERKTKKISDIHALENIEKLIAFFEKEAKKKGWIAVDGINTIKENALFIKNHTDNYLSSLKHK